MPFISSGPTSGGGLEQAMSQVTVFGFPRSTFVKVVRLILTEKGIDYHFHDTEPEMYLPVHKQRHPFRRVPVLQHGDFLVYETTAIAAYIDEVLPGRKLTPADPRQRARMNQWISSLCAYFYPYMIYHITHERLVFPELGIASDEKVVAHALPKVENALVAIERELADGRDYLLGPELSIADFYLLPSTFAFSLTEEGKAMYPKYPAFCRWRERMESLPTTQKLRAILPPRAPIAHAREWAHSHRPRY